jgi:hypothetical protein
VVLRIEENIINFENITNASLTEMQAIVSTPLVPGTAKRTAFLPLVRLKTVTVWTSPAGSRYEKVDSESLSPMEMVAEILGEEENRRGFGLKRLSLRGREKLEERVLVLGDKSDVVVEEER